MAQAQQAANEAEGNSGDGERDREDEAAGGVFVRTAEGTPVDLWAQGASISFVCTIATRDGG